VRAPAPAAISKRWGTWTVLFAACAASAHADTLDTRGMAPHEQCAYCHGLDGNSVMARFPHLAGQSAAYLKKQLADFKQGRRTNDSGAMSGIAEALSDTEIETIVRHFARQVLRPRAADAEGDVVMGRRLYFSGKPGMAACVSCHGTAKPATAAAPRIGGQHAAYLVKQLGDFRAGARRNDAQGVMHAIAKSLSPAEVDALSAFLASGPVMTGASR